MITTSKCEDFAAHFKFKLDTIRWHLSQSQNRIFYTPEPLFLHEEYCRKIFLVYAEILGKVIFQLKPATYFLDPIPRSLKKTKKKFHNFFNEDLLNIVNYSLHMSVFPTSLRNTIIKPQEKQFRCLNV